MSSLAIFLFITLLLASSCVSISNTGPVITLSYGSFQGNLTGDVVEFLGIPFAAPPYAFYSIFSSYDTEKYFYEVLGIFDLLLQNFLGILLEFNRLLVLEQLARSKQQIPPLFQASAHSTPLPLRLLKIVSLPLILTIFLSNMRNKPKVFLSMSSNQPTSQQERNYQYFSWDLKIFATETNAEIFLSGYMAVSNSHL